MRLTDRGAESTELIQAGRHSRICSSAFAELQFSAENCGGLLQNMQRTVCKRTLQEGYR